LPRAIIRARNSDPAITELSDPRALAAGQDAHAGALPYSVQRAPLSEAQDFVVIVAGVVFASGAPTNARREVEHSTTPA
jgi:hypothetical protein